MGVLGSGENGVKKFRDQGAKENNSGSKEQRILDIISKNVA